MERDLLKVEGLPLRVLRERVAVKFAFILEPRDSFPVVFSCRVLRVSRSGYYAWFKREPSEQTQRQQQLVEQISIIHNEPNKRCYGSPWKHKELLARGCQVCENTVAKLMSQHDLAATSRRKFCNTTNSKHSHPVTDNRTRLPLRLRENLLALS